MGGCLVEGQAHGVVVHVAQVDVPLRSPPVELGCRLVVVLRAVAVGEAVEGERLLVAKAQAS
jgi:hypothetical protein